jgi:hypothetical protein
VAEHPDATADQVTEMLRRQGHPVSGVWVAVCMRRLRGPK